MPFLRTERNSTQIESKRLLLKRAVILEILLSLVQQSLNLPENSVHRVPLHLLQIPHSDASELRYMPEALHH